jgi:hypothetical protein
MLDPWIIEEIRRREEEQQKRDERPVIEMPLHGPRQDDHSEQGKPAPADEPRGVTVIDLLGR